jgi:polyisoprenoid-binding protein YceI
MNRLRASLWAVVLSLSLTGLAGAETYSIDDNHSNVNFTIRHLVGKVTGQFQTFTGNFKYDPKDPKSWSAVAAIQAASINTGNAKRDDHLRSAEFFDVAKFPTLTFKSTGITDIKDNTAKMAGELTMHGVTKPVVLNLEITPPVKDPFGAGQRMGATATGKINRKDFGISYNKTLDSGGLMLGEEVDIVLNIEGATGGAAKK